MFFCLDTWIRFFCSNISRSSRRKGQSSPATVCDYKNMIRVIEQTSKFQVIEQKYFFL